MSARSARRRILLGRETLLGLLVVALLAGVCVMLGLWQYGRYEDRRDEAAVIGTNYDAAPVALDEVLPDSDAPLAPADEWTPVTLHGSYCTAPDCVLYVRNRQLSGVVGFWQLVPFRADSGTTLLVVRGWVPSDDAASAPADPPAIPAGDLSVTVRLHPAEVVLDREPPPGQTHSVNPRQSAGLMGLDAPGLVTQAYGELAAEEPAAERPAALPAPDTSLGPHLSYAFQWWVFALFFPAALVHRTRRQLQDLADDERRAGEAAGAGTGDPGGAAAGEQRSTEPVPSTTPAAAPDARRPRTDHRPRRAVRSRRRGRDEEEEDALIDQQP